MKDAAKRLRWKFQIDFLNMPETETTKKKIFFRKENLFFIPIFIVFILTAVFFTFKNFTKVEAVGTFYNDFSTIDDAEAITGWTASTTCVANIALNTDDIAMQGTNGIEWTITTNGGCQNSGIFKTLSPTRDLTNQQLWLYFFTGKSSSFTDNVKEHFNFFDIRLQSQNGTSTWRVCNSLSDCSSVLKFGVNSFKIFTTQPTFNEGSPDLAQVDRILLGFGVNSKMVKKAGAVMGFDYWRAGTRVGFSGGTASDPVTFADVKSYSDTNALDVIAIDLNAITLKSSLEIGTTSLSTFFTEKNRYIGMSMVNSDDKISYILNDNSTTTFGAFENAPSNAANAS